MNELTIFKNENFGEVRTVIIDGEPWFVLKDICRALSLSNPSKVAKRLDSDEIKKVSPNPELGLGNPGDIDINVINESGVYSVVLRSDKPEARLFKRWLVHDVIPQIRRNGIYATKEVITKILNDPSCVIEIFSKMQSLQDRCQTLELSNNQSKQLIGELQPKATYYDLILQNKSTIPITQIAKDYGMSGVAFNKMLHELGIQYKMERCWLLYQKYADQGYTQSKTVPIDAERSVIHTQWTQKGRIFIYDILKNRCGLLPVIERTTKIEGEI